MMVDYQNVPVPNYLVMDVLKLISNAEAATQAATPDVPGDGSDDSRTWTRQELLVLWDNRDHMSSVGRFCSVLTLLAESAPDPLRRDQIATSLGIEPVKMVNSFGRLTSFMEKRLPGKRWPLVMDDRRGWSMDTRTAELWQSIAEA